MACKISASFITCRPSVFPHFETINKEAKEKLWKCVLCTGVNDLYWLPHAKCSGKAVKTESDGRNYFSVQLKRKQYNKNSPAHFFFHTRLEFQATNKTFQSFSWSTPVSPLSPDLPAQATPSSTPACIICTNELHQVGGLIMVLLFCWKQQLPHL